MRKFFAISLVLLLAACTGWDGPSPGFMDMDPPGPPEYKQGWRHGCESGFATYGTALNKAYYAFYQDFYMMDDRYYNAGWHEAFNFCRHYNYKWNTHDWTSS